MNTDPIKQLASNLVFLREDMQLSRDQLATILGCSRTQIAKIESCKTNDPSWFFLEKISSFYGVTSQELIYSDLTSLDIRKQAINRVSANFTDTQWESLIDLVTGATNNAAKSGFFRIRK